jgi:hypothetical protein
MTKKKNPERDRNPDPITGEPGSHPVGTGVGAAGGAAAGAAVGGAVGGPVGAAVGGVTGAIVGGAAGHKAAEQINPTVEEAYWRQEFQARPYVDRSRPWSDYGPAYRYGWESRSRLGARPYGEVERDLERGWENAKGESRLAWNQAKDATRDAWHRIERAMPGDLDRDGR